MGRRGPVKTAENTSANGSTTPFKKPLSRIQSRKALTDQTNVELAAKFSPSGMLNHMSANSSVKKSECLGTKSEVNGSHRMIDKGISICRGSNPISPPIRNTLNDPLHSIPSRKAVLGISNADNLCNPPLYTSLAKTRPVRQTRRPTWNSEKWVDKPASHRPRSNKSSKQAKSSSKLSVNESSLIKVPGVGHCGLLGATTSSQPKADICEASVVPSAQHKVNQSTKRASVRVSQRRSSATPKVADEKKTALKVHDKTKSLLSDAKPSASINSTEIKPEHSILKCDNPLPSVDNISCAFKRRASLRVANSSLSFETSRPAEKKMAIYKTKLSPPRTTSKGEGEYEFEVDENEPKAKKKQKRILRFTKRRRKKPLNREESYIAGISKSQLPSIWGSTDDLHSKVNSSEPKCKSDNSSVVCHQSVTKAKQPTPIFFSPIEEVEEDDAEIPVLLKSEMALHSPLLDDIPAKTYSAIDHGSRIYCDIPDQITPVEKSICASTPVRQSLDDNDTFCELDSEPSDFDKSNCFGFQDPNELNSPLLSPIKTQSLCSTPHSNGFSSRLCELPSPRCEIASQMQLDKKYPVYAPKVLEMKSAQVKTDVQDVIQLLKERGKEEDTSQVVSVCVFDDPIEAVSLRKPLRRSYERPSFLRNLNKSFEEESEEEVELKTVVRKPAKKKLHGAPDNKPSKEFEKWAQDFNSQCAEVEKFDLVVE